MHCVAYSRKMRRLESSMSKSKESAAHHKLKKNKNNLQTSGMLDSHLVQVSMVKTTHGCSSYLMIYGATKQSDGIEKTVV